MQSKWTIVARGKVKKTTATNSLGLVFEKEKAIAAAYTTLKIHVQYV